MATTPGACAWTRVLLLLILGVGLMAVPGCGGGGGGGGGGEEPAPQTGRAVLGPLAGATVEIYEVRANADFDLLHSETTSTGPDPASTGFFDAHREALSDDGLYVVKVSGGRDVDADDDGVLDPAPTENRGVVRAVGTGAMLKAGVFRVNMLTEIAYRGVGYLLMSGYDGDELLEGLDAYAAYLLEDDVDGNGEVGAEDLLAWQPLRDVDALRKHRAHFAGLVEAIHADDEEDVQKQATMLSDTSVAFLDFEQAEDVVTDGSYAYLAAHEDGVRVVDLSNPRLPRIVASVDTNEADGVFLVGDLLYVADDDGLQIVDVTNPMNPVKRGKAVGGSGDEMEWADDVVVSGNYAFVAEGEHGRLRVIDVSDPDAPSLVNTYETGRDWGDGVAISGHHVYVADGDGVTVLDATDPLHMSEAAQVDTDGDADQVVVSGNLLFVASGGDDGLVIYDITDPANPAHRASVWAPMDCEGIAVHGDYAYLTQRDAGVQIVDVSDPADPDHLGTCLLFGEMNGICCGPDYALVAAEDHGGLRVVDVSPLSPALYTNTLALPVLATVVQDVDDVVTDGRYAYMVREDEVASLDLQNPEQPIELDSIDINGAMDGEPARVVLDASRDLLYVTMGWRGVQVVDVSTPSALTLRDQYDEHLGPQHLTVDVAVQGNHVYTAETHLPRFLAIDVSNPDSVAFAGQENGPNHGMRGVAMLDATHVCCAWGFAGIQVVDVTDPTNPGIVGGDTLPAGLADPHDGDHVSNLATHASHAYVSGNDGIWIVDASTPSNPTVKGQLDAPEVLDFDFAGNHMYMAAQARGVAIGNTADPTNPRMVARLALDGRCIGIAVHGDYLLVATGWRLLVLRRPLTETLP